MTKKTAKNNWIYKEGELKPKAVLILSLIVLSVILVFVIATPFLVNLGISICKPSSNSGLFGDQYGLTNAIFSGIALAAVAMTLLLQSHELRMQREENDDTQEILKGQEQQAKKQADLMKQQLEQLQSQGFAIARQNFESAFFNLYSVFSDARISSKSKLKGVLSMLDDHIHRTSGHDTTTRDRWFDLTVINARHSLITNHFDHIDENCKPKSEYEYRYLCAMSFYWLYSNINDGFSPYFKTLQSVLLHIETWSNNKIPTHIDPDNPNPSLFTKRLLHEIGVEEQIYSSIVRSQITPSEMLLLAFVVDHPSHNALRRLLCRYGFFNDFQTAEYQYRYITMPNFLSDSIELIPTPYDE